jgi:hypothetical protein
MPTVEGFCRRLGARHGMADSLPDIIRENWSQLTLPEALNTEGINNYLAPDNPGRKQAFTGASWVSLLVSLFSGIQPDSNGIEFKAPLAAARSWQWKKLRWGDKELTLDFTGNGNHVTGLSVNGHAIPGNRLDSAHLTQSLNRITVITGEEA